MIPYGRQQIDEDDIAAVTAVLRSDFLTTGPAVDAFEAALADVCSTEYAVVCSNGTAALYMASKALGLGDGDVVIVPAITFLATSSAPFLAGSEIVFSDVDPETGLMRPEDLETAIIAAGRRFPDKRVAAAFVVQLNGQSADMPGLKTICDRENLALVEDACHALGGLTRCSDDPEANGAESRIGDTRWSDLACFSFHPVKTIAMGEGGAVTTRDAAMAERLRLHRNHGMERNPQRWVRENQGFARNGEANPWYYELTEPGFNFRAPDILCALGTSQLRRLSGFVSDRAALFARYQERLENLNQPVQAPAVVPWGRPAWHLCAARVDFDSIERDRGAVMRDLSRQFGIGTQVHYIPLHRQPFWADRYGLQDLPGADRYYSRALSLPLFVGMDESDVDRVVDALAKAL